MNAKKIKLIAGISVGAGALLMGIGLAFGGQTNAYAVFNRQIHRSEQGMNQHQRRENGNMNNHVNEEQREDVRTNERITQEQAEAIALGYVQGRVLRTELDTEHGVTYFEVYIELENGHAEVYINADTGELIRIDEERGRSNASSNEGNQPPTQQAPAQQATPNANGFISIEEAQRIALEAVGGGSVAEVELYAHLGRYELFIRTGGSGGMEVYIDARTGAVLKIEADDWD